MKVRILGSAAGGGVPQWNCRCANCEAARTPGGAVRPRTQSSVAISADGQSWLLVNVSPDIRQQIQSFPALGPPAGDAIRGTSIAGCVLTDAELDHTAGLLLLREGARFPIYATAAVRGWLSRWWPVEPILAAFSNPPWQELPLNGPLELDSGITIRAIELDRHIPRFVKDSDTDAIGSVIALEVIDRRTGGRLLYAPCIARLQPALDKAARQADCLLLDGTFWDDEEPRRLGIGSRTASEMGHWPVSGPGGSLAWLRQLPAREQIYVHINNTNAMLKERGPEHQAVISTGIKVGSDGDTFDI